MIPFDFAAPCDGAPPARNARTDPPAVDLLARFEAVRRRSLDLAAPLGPEDMCAQSMPDASPVKWHLAHTTWFFETFALVPRGVARADERFAYLFNSYYETLGPRQPRPQRGLMTRPTCEEVFAYRRHVDQAVTALLSRGVDEALAETMALGFAHEEQHQELLLTDLLHLFAQNALEPAYRPASDKPAPRTATAPRTVDFEGGVVEIGHGGDGFAFDNEGPRHAVMLQPYRLATGLVTNAEWSAFMEAGGYRRPELWLSDGWATVQAQGWSAPLYWRDDGKAFGLYGRAPLDPGGPVEHISFYEADAYARWADARLPLEAEWEHAARLAAEGRVALEDLFGGVWQWTASPYVAYPRFRPAPGAVGEYNGKFMINQMILRGSSSMTSPGHSRVSYRNFFQPDLRWQAAGVRLAYDGVL